MLALVICIEQTVEAVRGVSGLHDEGFLVWVEDRRDPNDRGTSSLPFCMYHETADNLRETVRLKLLVEDSMQFSFVRSENVEMDLGGPLPVNV
jgi:hypothetical protein